MSCNWLPWPWSGGGGDPAPAPASSPLLLVPGVCGTMLGVRPKASRGDGERCWVTVQGAEAAYKRLWGRWESESGRVELLDPASEVCVPRGADDSGLYAISVLDPDVALLTSAVHYFEPLITYLQGQGYTSGVNLFGFGYDFRQSCRLSAEALLRRLQEVSQRCSGARVHLVSHSMGGLVVRSLLADHPAEFEALVGRWIAIGCPFGGAPGYAVDALITGVQWGGSLGETFWIPRESFMQAAVQSPAIYELLPPLDFPWAKPPPQLTLWLREPIPPPPEQQPAAPEGPQAAALPCASHREFAVSSQQAAAVAAAAPAGGAAGCSAGPGAGVASSSGMFSAHQYVFQHDHLPGLLARLLQDNTVEVGGATIPLPFLPELWALGQDTHASWSDARLPPSCSFYNLHGTGFETPYSVQYGAWWYPVQGLDSVPKANAAFTYVDGDGTVPRESATAQGLEATASAAVMANHRGLVASQEVWTQVLRWLRQPLPAVSTSGAAALMHPRQCTAERPVLHAAADGDLLTPLVPAAEGEDTRNPLVWWALLA